MLQENSIFLEINPYVTTTNKPIEKIGNTTIEELKKRFNLEMKMPDKICYLPLTIN